MVTATVERPFGYGRIVRVDGELARIVEERDASPAERQIHEINSGIYAFDLAPLFDALRSIASQNAQGEYYLTDLVAIYRRRKLLVKSVLVDDPQEVRGVNSRTELAEVSRLVRQKKNEELMAAGVTLVDPAATYIDPDVEIGADTVIHPGVIIEGRTRIGAACEIHAHVTITDTEIGDNVTIKSFSVITSSRIDAGAQLGPFAHLRPETVVGEGARIGNFVELKKTTLGPHSKANHLSYLGDATIGTKVNVGAGTITCNYDGEHKHETVIEDGAFIGSDSQLIAPVRVGKGAYVAAGSSITQDVPAGALGIARGRQSVVNGWVERRKQDSSNKTPTSRKDAGKPALIACAESSDTSARNLSYPSSSTALRRMEYRGYDSAGVALVSPEGIELRAVRRQVGESRECAARRPCRRRLRCRPHTMGHPRPSHRGERTPAS